MRHRHSVLRARIIALWLAAFVLAPTIIGVLLPVLGASLLVRRADETRYQSHIFWLRQVGLGYVLVAGLAMAAAVVTARELLFIVAVLLILVFMVEAIIGMIHAIREEPHRARLTGQFT